MTYKHNTFNDLGILDVILSSDVQISKLHFYF